MVISILCGGNGTRLWPISRSLMPKQFAKIIGNDSLFQLTLKRNMNLMKNNDKFHIITNDKYYFLALDIANNINIHIDSFILESLCKNTAAALTIDAILTYKQNPNEVILVLPSDHIINDYEKYKECVNNAYKIARDGYIVTFGITPTTPHTGYGYIQSESTSNKYLMNVISFHEKPDKKTAKEYLSSGRFYWNSGMFCYKAKVLLDEIKKYEPDIYKSCLELVEYSLKNANNNSSFLRLDKSFSEKIPDKSIDYAVMEKTQKLAMIKADFQWNDVGSFDSLCDELPKDSNNNITNSNNILLQSNNNLIMSDKMVATIGIDDCIIIDTFDALLIVKKGQTQNVKEIVSILNKNNSKLTEIHNKAFRPWGNYTTLQENSNYKLKSIVVKPKHRLSLQKHYHRNEHWIVVSGSAIVQIGNKEVFLGPNESTYIPMGESHRLTNPGKIDLVMIEVQVGDYLEEDDIVRLDDDYSRN